MKKFFALALLSAAGMASAAGIASGQSGGTNYAMVDDIVSVCSKPAARLNNVPSNGSQDNVDRVYGDKAVQYGIAQVDVLEYLRGQDPRMMDKILAVFPFFSTELHLVAGQNSQLAGIASLAGKRVAVGPEGSGTWVTAQVMKKLIGINWIDVPASNDAGFAMVKSGQVDAQLLVAGAPVPLLQKGTGFKLLPIDHPSLNNFALYTKARITAGTYPSVAGTVPTYKVDNVLVTFAFKTERQKEIGDLVSCITNNMGTLQRDSKYHAKWRDVTPTDLDRVKWATHPAALKAIHQAK